MKHQEAERILAGQIPRYLAELLRREGATRLVGRPLRKRGALLFCDVSGFTPLTETLGRHGKAGTEALTAILNEYFHILIGILEEWGGDVVKFGGDAVTVLFEHLDGEDGPENLLRACSCARAVFESLGAERRVETRWGEFVLSLKIGVSAGECMAGVLGDAGKRMEHILAGEALDRMADAEHHAERGEIVLDLSIPQIQEKAFDLERKGSGFARIRDIRVSVDRPSLPDPVLPPIEETKPFLLPAIWGHAEAGTTAMLSEHRPVVTVFVSFPPLDYAKEESLERLQVYFLKVSELLDTYGGSFNRMDMGDKGSKFLCFFGAPESQGNNEERAVGFALALQQLERSLLWLKGQRIGISVGTVYCGVMGSEDRREYTVMGDAVNVAARFMGAAGEERILAHEAIRKATAKQFRWGKYRSLTLKGKSVAVRASTPLHPLRRKRVRSEAAVGAFIGREDELATLQRLIRRASRKAVQTLVVSGEAGMGKTTLLQRFMQDCSRRRIIAAYGACPAVNPKPYEPWVSVFSSLLGSADADADSIFASWKALLPDQEPFLCLGMAFLGHQVHLTHAADMLNPQERQEKTIDLLAQTLKTTCERATVVVLIDDLHDADEATLELLNELVARAGKSRLAVVAASRPGVKWEQVGQAIQLVGLTRDASEALSIANLGVKRVPSSLVEFLVSRSAGNPLYLLELLQNLRERKILHIDRKGLIRWDPKTVSGLPSSVEELLLSRLDRLPIVARNVLKVASCLGATFDIHLLKAVYLPPTPIETLAGNLEALVSLGISRGEGAHRDIYTFPHPTLREVAYESILIANRKKIHQAAGLHLEKRPESMENPSTLAHHFSQAEDWDKALRYTLSAARASQDRFAFGVALDQYGRAQELAAKAGIPLQPEDLISVARCAVYGSDYAHALKTIESLKSSEETRPKIRMQAEELALKILDLKGEYESCARRGEELANQALKGNDPDIGLRAKQCEISSLFRLARLKEAARALEQAKRMADRWNLERQLADLAILGGAIAFQQGRYADAVAKYRDRLKWAEKEEYYPVAFSMHVGLANTHRESGNLAESVSHAERALELAKRIGSLQYTISATTTLATALNWTQKPQRALDVLEDIQTLMNPEKVPYAVCAYWNQLGVTQYFLGNLKRAIYWYRKCRALARRIGSGQWLAHGTYNIADALKEIGEKDKALKEYRQALRRFQAIEDAPYFVQTVKDMRQLIGSDREQSKAFDKRLRGMILRWKKPELLETLGLSSC